MNLPLPAQRGEGPTPLPREPLSPTLSPLRREREILALLLFALSGCATPKPELTTPSVRSSFSEKAIELELQRYPSLDTWKLSSLRGKVVLLDVWATWCEPCRDSLPLYGDLRQEFAAKGFEVVTINVDDDPLQIPLFLAEEKVTLPVVIDPQSRVVGSALGVKVMPTAFLLDRKGVIRHVHEGFNEELLSTWLTEIAALLEEKP